VRLVGNLLGDPRAQVDIGASVTAWFEQHQADPPFTSAAVDNAQPDTSHRGVSMELSFTAAHDRFRNDVREFFDTALTEELRAARRFMTSVYCDYETGMKWQRILLDKGWLVPSWPVEIRAAPTGR
jgi:hypothetical protein